MADIAMAASKCIASCVVGDQETLDQIRIQSFMVLIHLEKRNTLSFLVMILMRSYLLVKMKPPLGKKSAQ